MFKVFLWSLKKSGAAGAVFAVLLAFAAVFAAPSAAGAASVTTTHWKGGATEGYVLDFEVPDPTGAMDTVTLTAGPGTTGPVPLVAAVEDETTTFFRLSFELSNPPALNDAYTLNITYLDPEAPPAAVTVNVTGVVNSFATPVAPVGGVPSAANPTFSWTPPAAPPAGTYQFIVKLEEVETAWSSTPLGSGATTYQFPASTFSPDTAPTAGVTYGWSVSVVDQYGNRSENHADSFMLGANFQGRVTDLDGAGIADVLVSLYDANGTVQGDGAVLTQADGTYLFGGVTAGSYRVAFNKPPAFRVFYSNKLTLSQSDPLQIATGVVTTGVDAVIDAWGALSGKAVDLSGAPVAGISVQAYDTNGVIISSVPAATTKADGKYFVGLLPAGSYKLKFTGLAQGYAESWYNDGASVTVNVGYYSQLVDSTLPKLNITGKVTNASGVGIPNIWIWLYKDGSLYFNFFGAKTEADGSYMVGGVTPGSYKINFDDSSNTYVDQFYNQKASVALADAVTIGATGVLTNINAVLGTGKPTITGFSVPATSASLAVSGIVLTATEPGGVAGYLLTESATPPAASATGWSATAPTSYTFASLGTKTLYAWAKGATGIVSDSATATVSISAPAKAGDCDGNSTVSIAEVQSAINMYLGLKAVELCVDMDGNSAVSIAEVQQSINSFLGL